MAWAFVGVAVLLLMALAGVVGHRVGRSRSERAGAARLAVLGDRLVELQVAQAGSEARGQAAVAEAERLRAAAADLEATLADAQQEKTRLDYELRQVGLAACRVPELEQRLEELGRTQQALADAHRRLAELEPVAVELDLREQFIESLQRELVHRDERVLALEQRVDQLPPAGRAPAAGREPPSLPLASVVPPVPTPATAGPATPGHDGDGGAPSPGAPGRSNGARPGSNGPAGSPEPASPGVAAAGAPAEEPAAVDDDVEAPVAGPQVGRALQQALHGLGVRSFSDLGVFDPSTSDAG